MTRYKLKVGYFVDCFTSAADGVNFVEVKVTNEAVYDENDIISWESVVGKLVRQSYVERYSGSVKFDDPIFDKFVLVELPINRRGVRYAVVCKDREI